MFDKQIGNETIDDSYEEYFSIEETAESDYYDLFYAMEQYKDGILK